MLHTNQSAPNLLNICIDRNGTGDYGGRLYHKYQIEEVPFQTIHELLLILERFFDDLQFPQAASREHRFLRRRKTRARKGMEQVQDNEKMIKQQGDIATFVVHVQYRQNATWQGEIMWAEKRKQCRFRSALEMIKLMDQAIQTRPLEQEDTVEEDW